jgi:hypothetical protein
VASFSAPARQKSKPKIQRSVHLQVDTLAQARSKTIFATKNIPTQFFMGSTNEEPPTNRFLLAAICYLIASYRLPITDL